MGHVGRGLSLCKRPRCGHETTPHTSARRSPSRRPNRPFPLRRTRLKRLLILDAVMLLGLQVRGQGGGSSGGERSAAGLPGLGPQHAYPGCGAGGERWSASFLGTAQARERPRTRASEHRNRPAGGAGREGTPGPAPPRCFRPVISPTPWTPTPSPHRLSLLAVCTADHDGGAPVPDAGRPLRLVQVERQLDVFFPRDLAVYGAGVRAGKGVFCWCRHANGTGRAGAGTCRPSALWKGAGFSFSPQTLPFVFPFPSNPLSQQQRS